MLNKRIFFLGISVILICYSCVVFSINTKRQPFSIELKSAVIDVPSLSAHNLDSLLSVALMTKSIILLGEAEHTDETTFEFKTKIIKYLHEKLGFDVLMFEAGRFNFDYLNAENEVFDTVFFQNTLWDFWANSKSCRQLFSYIDSLQYSDNNIFINGFDIQPSGILFASKRQQNEIVVNYKIVKTTKDYLAKKGTSLSNYKDIKQMMYYIDYQGYLGKFQQSKYDSIKNSINDLISICYKTPATRQDTILAKFFSNFYNYIEMSRLQYGSTKRFQFRDSLMAENFFDIYENQYANKKVIVWLSNLHALYDDTQYETKNAIFQFSTFAEYLKKRYNDKVYSICFTSFTNLDKQGRVFNEATPSTLEYQLHKEKYKFAFIDLKKDKSIENKAFKTRVNQNLILNAKWAKMCDGIVYIDTVLQNK